MEYTSYNGIQLVWVPGGSFRFGREAGSAGSGDYSPMSTVILTGFYLGKYEVTQAQYQAVTGSNPSFFSGNPVSGEAQDRRPVERVSWYDAIAFCNALSVIEGLTPAYRISGSADPASWGTVPASWDDPLRALWDKVQVAPGSTGYRLPTEAQWEYAAKGGANPDEGYTYAGSNCPGDAAWYRENCSGVTHEVGKKVPNGLGLYDMSGNVLEWCWDWYRSYISITRTDPAGASSGSGRMGRGGSWGDDASYLRSVYRYRNYPSSRNRDIGFRVSLPQ